MRYSIGFLIAVLSFEAHSSAYLAKLARQTEENRALLKSAAEDIGMLAAERHKVASLTRSLETVEADKAKALSERNALATHLVEARTNVADLSKDLEEVRRIAGAAASPDPTNGTAAHVRKALAAKSEARRSAVTARMAAEAIAQAAQAEVARQADALRIAAAQADSRNKEFAALEAMLQALRESLATKDRDNVEAMRRLTEANAATEEARTAAVKAKEATDTALANYNLAQLKAEEVTPLKTRISALESELSVAEASLAALQARFDREKADLDQAVANLQTLRDETTASTKRVGELEAQLAEAHAKSAANTKLIATITEQLEEARAGNTELTSRLAAAQTEMDEKISANVALAANLEQAKKTFADQEEDLKTQLRVAHTKVQDIQRELSSANRGRKQAEEALYALQRRMQEVIQEHEIGLRAKTLELQETANKAIAEEKRAKEEAINKLVDAHKEQLAAIESDHAEKIAMLGAGHETERAELNRLHDAAIQEMTANHAQTVEAINIEARKKLDTIEQQCQAQLTAATAEQQRLAARILILEGINQESDRQLESLRTQELPRLMEQQAQLLEGQYVAQKAALSAEHVAALQAEREAKAELELRIADQVRAAHEKEEALAEQISANRAAMIAAASAFKEKEAELKFQIASLQTANTASAAHITELSEKIHEAEEGLTKLRNDHALQLKAMEDAASVLREELVALREAHAAETKRLSEALEASAAQIKVAQAAYAEEKAALEVHHDEALKTLQTEAASYKAQIDELLRDLGLAKDDAQKAHKKNDIAVAAQVAMQAHLKSQKGELRNLTDALAKQKKILEERDAALRIQEELLAGQAHTHAAQTVQLTDIKAERECLTAALTEVQSALSSLQAQHAESEEIVRKLTFEQDATNRVLEQTKEELKSRAGQLLKVVIERKFLAAKVASFEEALSYIAKTFDKMSSREDEQDLGEDMGEYLGEDMGEYLGEDMGEYLGEDTGKDRSLPTKSALSSITPEEVFAKVTNYYSKIISQLKDPTSAPIEVTDGGLDEDEIDELVAAPIMGKRSSNPTVIPSAAEISDLERGSLIAEAGGGKASEPAADATDIDAVVKSLLNAPILGRHGLGAVRSDENSGV